MSSVTDEQWQTTDEVAARLHVDPTTVRLWRRQGYGPSWTLFGQRKWRCRLSDLIAFEKEREQATQVELDKWRQVAS